MNPDKHSTQAIAQSLACAHFVRMYEIARDKARGGAGWNQIKTMTLEAFMEQYAPNGLRFSYHDEWCLAAYEEQVKRIIPAGVQQPKVQDVEEGCQHQPMCEELTYREQVAAHEALPIHPKEYPKTAI